MNGMQLTSLEASMFSGWPLWVFGFSDTFSVMFTEASKGCSFLQLG